MGKTLRFLRWVVYYAYLLSIDFMLESTLEFSKDTVLSRIDRQVQKAPNTVALIDIEGRTLTYLSLYQQIQSIGIQLKSINISRNDRVAVALPNGAEMAVAFLSIASVATCAPLNPAYRVQEFEFY
ncbi:MAG: AMP-binding protein, partial [Cyanobacteriota bacterium]|nr:AMP-binding protein [Cyanobacteriota bacterium]